MTSSFSFHFLASQIAGAGFNYSLIILVISNLSIESCTGFLSLLIVFYKNWEFSIIYWAFWRFCNFFSRFGTFEGMQN